MVTSIWKRKERKKKKLVELKNNPVKYQEHLKRQREAKRIQRYEKKRVKMYFIKKFTETVSTCLHRIICLKS